ncbi:phosphatidylcholine transfer protein-like [Babylonia areolata]|uniref:phosphatidylcholine transfer protein-like n=1 Tax=Babylonia areolata TaxID=304850 RepID=UPI003FD03F22
MMASGFEEEQFVQACCELEQPQVEGWELFVQCHGYSVYRLFDKSSGLYQYKTYGVMEGVTPEVCADVFMDYQYRQRWDAYVKAVYETQENGQHLVFWETIFPFPMSNREYVFRSELQPMEHKGRRMWVALVRSVPSTIPERPGVVRVDSFAQTCVLTSDGKFGTKSFMYYFDNPKGNIPTWMVNWAAKKGIPEFIITMQDACRAYPSYKAQQQRHQRQQ